MIRRRTGARRACAALALAAGLAAPAPAAATPRVLDAFEDAAPWSAMPASGVTMRLSTEPGPSGRCLRVDFHFEKGGGYAVLHRALDFALPANYRFTVRLRGATAPQNLEFKLIDASGENVWWCNRRDFAFPAEWTTLATRRRQIEFAWGPAGGGAIERVAAVEFAITAGSGGRGTVWFDDLALEELPPPSATPPPISARASSAAPGGGAARAVDGDSATAWRARRADARPWIELDLGEAREFGGLVLDWVAGAHPRAYAVRLAGGDGAWRTVREVRGGNGGRDWLRLPDSEARRVRIEAAGPPARGVALADVEVLPVETGATANRFLEAAAKRAPRGHYPRGARGELQYWSAVGSPGGPEEGYFTEDGAVDLGTGMPSLEPFLWAAGRLWTWADVSGRQRLVDGRLPLPAVTWEGAPVALEIRPRMVSGSDGGAEALRVRYRVHNASRERRAGRLLLAARPFQGNPAAQFLNRAGGVAALGAARVDEAGVLHLDTLRAVSFTPPPADAGAATFATGDVVEFLAAGTLPPRRASRDPEGLASAALAWPYDLAPGESLVVEALAPMTPGRARSAPAAGRADAARGAPWPAGEADARVVAAWRAATGPAEVKLPPSAREVERTLAAQIGWIQVNRDGPSIKPGSRAYDRSWIRDGALTCSALLRWGRHEEVRAFLEWFATFQYADGKVPCCVDWRGSDPVPEHDSHGQFIYLAAEYYRHTGDRATVERLWPHVAAAAAYLDTLRAQRLGPAWRTRDRIEFHGILPPSISHEGYSAKPMHSYWDDFFAVRGYRDAAWLARVLGRGADARRIAASGAALRRDFAASIRAAMKRHGVAYVPGSADLGDFDATSTTIALSPVQAAELAPPGAIEATFERYWEFFTRRRDGRERWEAFTPYEIRNVGAFVRLGWRERAHQLVAWFLAHRAPAGWAQWSEIVWNDPPGARFLGDIPHTWVGSDFVRAVLEMLAYEREHDDALVVAGGVPEAWVREADGVAVRKLDTWHGPLSYRMRAAGRGIALELDAGPRVPRGGIVIAAPGVTPRWRATVNGRPAPVTARGEVVVRALPARVTLAP
uniref:Coagulation factor 5/8 type domain-containing protein n=1 Tax=Eiseniibacteriota bacterium TaxID=2212470 RepID=A0A832I2P0_UNCEI